MEHPLPKGIIDLAGIQQLKDAIDENIKAAQKGYGKKLVVVIGATRAGKSTLIELLKGTNIVRKVKIVEIEIDGEVYKEEKAVFAVKGSDDSGIGHQRYIACTDTMKFYSVGEHLYIIVDTAGLFDTNGPILEIAHKAAFDYILKHAESIKPIVLINFEEFSGSGSAIKSLAKTVSSIFNNDPKKLDESLTICLTHIENVNSQEISTRFLEMWKASQSSLLSKAINWLRHKNPKIQFIKDPCSYNKGS